MRPSPDKPCSLYRVVHRESGKDYVGISVNVARTQATIDKRKLSLIGRPLSDEHKAKISAANKGWKHTEESKEAMRVARLKRGLAK